jgi:hypothetical protein
MTTSTDYGRGTTRSDNSPGTAGGLSFATLSAPESSPESGSDLQPVQPLPLGPVYADAAEGDLQSVQPLPLGPVYADAAEGDLQPVQPLPLGPTYADAAEGGLQPVQPLPLGPVYAEGPDSIMALIGSDSIEMPAAFAPMQDVDWMTPESPDGMLPGQEAAADDHGDLHPMAESVIDFSLPNGNHLELLAG